MKRLLKTLLLILAITISAGRADAQDLSGFVTFKTNLRIDLGLDVGMTIGDFFGAKVGIMTDIFRPTGDEYEVINQYKKAIGEKYRLSYCCGPMVKVLDCLWLSATAGYGEYGIYGYSANNDMYGISGKICGLEVGAQIAFLFDLYSVELGYSTIPKGFSLNNPLNDVSIGFGVWF